MVCEKWCQFYRIINWQKTGQWTEKTWGRGWVVLVVSTKWQDILLTSWGSSLRKQPIFRDVSNSFPVKWHQRTERRNFILMTMSLPRSGKCFWLVMPRGKFVSTSQKHYPDLGNDMSSVWNFCARFSDVISWGSRWWRHKMSAVFSGYFLMKWKNKNLNMR